MDISIVTATWLYIATLPKRLCNLSQVHEYTAAALGQCEFGRPPLYLK